MREAESYKYETSPSKVEEELASSQEVHHHIQLQVLRKLVSSESYLGVRLEGIAEAHDERVGDLREDVSLGSHVREVVLLPQQSLRDDLHCVQTLVSGSESVAHQVDSSEASLADQLEDVEVLRPKHHRLHV